MYANFRLLSCVANPLFRRNRARHSAVRITSSTHAPQQSFIQLAATVHIHGTQVPMEEPSTALPADIALIT